jgi:hypothetical protein
LGQHTSYEEVLLILPREKANGKSLWLTKALLEHSWKLSIENSGRKKKH